MKSSFCAAQEAHQKVGLIALLRKDDCHLPIDRHSPRESRTVAAPLQAGLLKFKFLLRMRRFSKRSHEVRVK